MARRASPHPTEGELEILRVLWELGPAPLGRICEQLRRQRPVASSTVATMLKVMHEKGLVVRRPRQRGSLWEAKRSREATGGRMLAKLIDDAFEGSASRLVAHLVEKGRLSTDDRAAILAMLRSDARRRSARKGGPE